MKTTPLKLSFADRDGSRGVHITLKESASPEDVAEIRASYEKIGWKETTRNTHTLRKFPKSRNE